MTILMPFLGSRGDVQPGIALAIELSQRGYQPLLGVPPNLVQLARQAGVDAVPMGPDSRLLLESELVQVRSKSGNPFTRVRALAQLGTFGWRELAAELDGVATGAEVIVTSFLGQEVARAIADKHELAQVAVHFCPVRPARSVSLFELPAVGADATNRVVWAALDRSWRALTRRGEDQVRADLGLPASSGPLARRMASAAALEVQAIDPLLFPQLPAEWGIRRPLVGFVDVDDRTLEAICGTDPSLDAWLDDGPPPIYWGFGSMPVTDPAATLELVRSVSAALGARSLVSAGWSEFTAAADDQVRVEQSVNHRAVLPRCAVSVHHGGAGTTAAALRAGTPSLVAWFGADQHLWGRRLAELGVGSVTRFAELQADTVTAALRELMSAKVRARASQVRAQMIDPTTATRALADLVERAHARHLETRTGGDAPLPARAVTQLADRQAPAATRYAVETQALTCSFGGVPVVDGVDLNIEQGKVFALLGPNGAGKTTIVRMLATLQPPTAGSASVFGYDIREERHRVRSLIALTGQYAAVDEDLTARENLMIFARLLGFSRPAAKQRAQELLESFSLTHAADRTLRNFSGGMRRRLDLAASLIARPPLIFLDEPTTGLDPRTRVQLWETVRSLVADGATVLLTTQYLEEADQLADRIAVINHGKVVAEGTADELKRSVGTANLRVNVTTPADLAACAEITQRLVGREVARLDQRTISVPLTQTAVVADVLIALRRAQIEVAEVSVQKPTLDEVFFDLTSHPVAADQDVQAA